MGRGKEREGVKRHIAYLKYVLRHKWFVLVAGRKTGAPVLRLLLHDLSKFRPSEWRPYAETFYGHGGETMAFDAAWLKHQHRNDHHWQHWILRQDDPEPLYGARVNGICNFVTGRLIGVLDGDTLLVGTIVRDLVAHANLGAGLRAMRMPEDAVREMVADWAGADRAITGKWEVAQWYARNKDTMQLHPDTRLRVEDLLRRFA